ncbi:MAG: response regulator [Acidobacteriota bacterium]
MPQSSSSALPSSAGSRASLLLLVGLGLTQAVLARVVPPALSWWVVASGLLVAGVATMGWVLTGSSDAGHEPTARESGDPHRDEVAPAPARVGDEDDERITRLETELAELQASREETEAVGRENAVFLANLGHAIRTPLHGIIGLTDLVLDAPLGDAEAEHLRMVRESADRLLLVLAETLERSRCSADSAESVREAFSPRACVQELLDEQTSRGGVSPSLKVAPEVPEELIGDRPRLSTALGQLVGHLSRRPSGETELGIEVQSWSGPTVTLAFWVADDRRTLVPEERAEVQAAIAGAEPPTSEAVLGLRLARENAQALGGRVELDEAGKGTTLRLVLPFALRVRSAPDAEATSEIVLKESDTTRPSVPAVPTPAPAPRRVLLVEDDPISQAVGLGLLERSGHRVVVAADGHEALDALAEESFDLVLLDCCMPGLDGFEVARRLRAAEPSERRVPVVAVSALTEPEDQQRALDAGMDEHLAKPLDRARFQSVLERLLVPGERPHGPFPRLDRTSPALAVGLEPGSTDDAPGEKTA